MSHCLRPGRNNGTIPKYSISLFLLTILITEFLAIIVIGGYRNLKGRKGTRVRIYTKQIFICAQDDNRRAKFF